MEHAAVSVKDIRERIQFLVTVIIFFSTAILLFYKAIGSSDDILSGKNSLIWGIGVAFCIWNYIFIGLVSERFIYLRAFVHWLIGFNIFVFAIPIFVLAITVDHSLPGYYGWFFKPSFVLAIWLPIFTFLVIGLWEPFYWIGYWTGRGWVYIFKRKKEK